MVVLSFNSSAEASDEAGKPTENVILLESVPNLRRIDAHGKLFRSSRQDRATDEDVRILDKSLGIQTYLDFRNAHEYSTIDSGRAKVIDGSVPIVVPDIRDDKTARNYPTDSTTPLKDLNGKPVTEAPSPRRYLINMFTKDVVLEVFYMAPWYKQIWTVLCVLIGILTGNHYLYFARCLSAEIIRHGLIGRYKGFLKYTGEEICFALKTISNPQNLPAVLCCTHGKDRTGIVTALVLSILGKTDEYIAEDYSLSEKSLEPIMPEMREEAVKYIPDLSFLNSKKETILKLLEHTRETYGSVENYLESIGFGQDDQNKLRQALS